MNIRKKMKIQQRTPCIYGKLTKLSAMKIPDFFASSQFYQTYEHECRYFYKHISTIF
jgi:hypothetical protein